MLKMTVGDEPDFDPKTRNPLSQVLERGYEMLALSTPNLMFPNTGRELTPVDKKFPSSPVVVASQGSSLSHSA